MSRTVISDSVDVSRIRPYGDFVLVEILEREKTAAGIFLVRQSATPCVLGRVLAAGPGVVDDFDGRLYPCDLTEGDVVLFMDYARDGGRLELRDGSYALLRTHGIWATVTTAADGSYDLESVEPRMDMVLVRPKDETTTSGGIHLPQGQMTENQMRLAEVLAVGPGQWETGKGRRKAVEARVGETVLMTRYAGAELEVRGETLRIINESDIQVGWED